MEPENDIYCYGSQQTVISLDQPGINIELPDYLIKQFRALFPSMRKRQIFFGGHPVSITRQSCQDIFTLDHYKSSPYLVCEKSDGVRYLLVVAKVEKEDSLRESHQQRDLITQCYFVSRKGHTALDASVVDIGVSFDMDFASNEVGGQRRHVVEILDGELVQQDRNGQPYFKYLVFDALVHLGKNICQLSLKTRLQMVQKFLRCNEMLGVQPHRIPIELKDFFRLVNRKFNVLQFLLTKYIKEIQHENDGILFNHEDKQYVIGTTNPGYIKWKPEHLNTVDFMVMPNYNLIENYGRRVLDLYTAVQDADLGRYTRQFYGFMVVSQQKFDEIVVTTEAREEAKLNKIMDNQSFGEVDQFGGALIVECNYDSVEGNQAKSILSQLTRSPVEDLRMQLMKQGEQQRDLSAIKQMKKRIYDKNWKIYKVREDKQLPNNNDVVRRIEESIRDGITKANLILRAKELNEKAFR